MPDLQPSLAGGACHPILRMLFAALEGRGIRWALLHTPDGGLAAPRGDVDLLLHPDDLRAADALIARFDFGRVPRPGRSHHYLRYCPEQDCWLWLHIVTWTGVGAHHVVPLDGERGCLTRRRVRQGIPLLEPALAFWLLLWRCLVSKGRVAPHHRSTLTELSCATTADDESARIFAAACGDRQLPAYLLRAVVDGNWTAVERCAPAVRDVEGPVPLPQRIIRGAWSRVQRTVASYRHRGLSVAVLGPDGAGKSTLVAGICASIPLPSRTIYMGLSGGALRHARRLRIPGLVFAATAAIIWSRYLRARYHQARGRLVVFDRYIYDAFAPHPNRLNPAQRLSRFLAGHLCPGPDMMVLLDAPGSVMYARKGAYTAATLENWRWHFRALASRLPSSHVIDATRSADAVRVDVLTALWRRQRERWAV